MAPELLFPDHVFWLGQHVYTRTCIHANNTQTAGSLAAVSAIFNFHFCFGSSSHIDILKAVGADCTKMACYKFTAKRIVDDENRRLSKNGLKNFQPAQDPCA